jgi:thiamine-phosphate pyrophosphorylase
VTDAPTGCELYAVVEAGPEAGARLAAALAAAEFAVALIAPAADQRLDKAAVQPLVDQARRAGVTVLLLGDAQLARTVGADGVHLATQDHLEAVYRGAREALGKDGVIGADAGISRHAAMMLAESGADYVGFGAPPHLKDLHKAQARREEMIAWWAPLFEVPCVAFDVETAGEAGQLADAGADFVAVALPAGEPASALDVRLRAIARAITAGNATPEATS